MCFLQAALTPVQAAVLRDASLAYKKATALPKDLVQRIARLETDAYVVSRQPARAGRGAPKLRTRFRAMLAQNASSSRDHTTHPRLHTQAWVEARKASDFSKFAPFLKEWIDVRREQVRRDGAWQCGLCS